MPIWGPDPTPIDTSGAPAEDRIALESVAFGDEDRGIRMICLAVATPEQWYDLRASFDKQLPLPPAMRPSSTRSNRHYAGRRGRSMNGHAQPMTLSGRADELEEKMMHELSERIATRSTLFYLGDGKVEMAQGQALLAANPGKHFLMGADPRLPQDAGQTDAARFLQTHGSPADAPAAKRDARAQGAVAKKSHHGVPPARHRRCRSSSAATTATGARRLLEPYVGEEVSWADPHASSRCASSPIEKYGYAYPDLYVKFFGADYKPEPYIVSAPTRRARNTSGTRPSRLITVNDIYSFDPDMPVTSTIRRHRRAQLQQPKEGLGFDNSPSSHMWRTLMWPTRFL